MPPAQSLPPLTCRAPAVPRSSSMLPGYMGVRVHPCPKLPPLEQNGCRMSALERISDRIYSF
jgi:hypothetical protein